ncbi:MAG TPA: polysaccharide biosynthesis protein [Terricaulis sp.]|nr:polysaccharide biosynthesis protein [Terricaulis sp.]
MAFEGRRVLITGAAGSVGAGLSLRLAAAKDIRLGLLDHFDHGLLRLADDIVEAAPTAKTELMLCSVREADAVARAMEAFAPDVVIHAAALKHVHLGEAHPGESLLTNLVGVRNALAAAHAAGAGEFILISTDKAASPHCVMGAAKRLAELHLRGFLRETGASMRLASVRFGNVLGSQGSVAPLFADQIERGGPITLTHPKMQRFFLTMDEAVSLILRVAAAERPESDAPTYVMDMGEPISILRLAEEMMARAGRNVPITITGLRPGEKLNEQWFDAHETVKRSMIPGLFEARPRSGRAALSTAEVADLENAARTLAPDMLRALVFACLEARLAEAADGGRPNPVAAA